MRKALKYIFILPLLALAAASCDYLDKREESSGLTLEDVFGNAVNYELYVEWMIQNPMLQYLQNGAHPHGSWDDITDNSMSTTNLDCPFLFSSQGNYWTMLTSDRCPMSNNEVWTRIWKHVRIANMGLKYIGMYPGDEAGRNKILGTCYFYRAFAYLELCRRWGGMPYFREPFDDLSINLDCERDDMRTTYLNVAEDFAEAAKYLPATVEPTEWQHPTSAAALGMRSRALLYAASKQAAEEGGSTRKELWAEAAQAADEAIKAAEDAGYAMAPEGSYYNIFKGSMTDIYTREVLFGRRAQIAWNSAAYLITIRPPGKLNGTYGVATNQTFVDCFDMTNGYPISDPKSGYNPQNPYAGRGTRFNHDILYNQATVFGNRRMDLFNQIEGQGKGGGDIAYSSGAVAIGYTPTGTYGIKWMGRDWNAQLLQIWPYIRMAELYLNFAEAANEADWSVSSVHAESRYTPLAALNKVRNRAGIADLPDEYKGQAQFRERVRNERRVELCFEDHRMFDLRRWKIGTQPENRDIRRVEITRLNPGYDAARYPTGFRYEYPAEPYLKRVYEERHDLFPVTRGDTYIGPLFKQNPGWEAE